MVSEGIQGHCDGEGTTEAISVQGLECGESCSPRITTGGNPLPQVSVLALHAVSLQVAGSAGLPSVTQQSLTLTSWSACEVQGRARGLLKAPPAIQLSLLSLSPLLSCVCSPTPTFPHLCMATSLTLLFRGR